MGNNNSTNDINIKNEELNELFDKTKNKTFNEYTEIYLKNPINMKDKNMQLLIHNLNKQENTDAYYNSVSYYCDTLGIMDTKNGTRWYEFEDDKWTMLNKGIDRGTKKTIYD